MAIIAAVINAIGKPLKAFGVFALSKRVLMQLNVTMINKKPIDVPKPFARASKKLRPWSVLPCATPNTAQLVVIKGK